ncbi:MAG: tyrosine-protein phosphatase [Myxococcota bacterium]
MSLEAPARWIDLEGCFNFRDLGGYRTAQGESLAPGQVFRSDGLQHLTARDLAKLRDEIGLGGVIDLRTQRELVSDGRGAIAAEPFDFHHVPLFDDDGRPREEPPPDYLADMTEMYRFLARAGRRRIVRVLRLIAESPRPVVFHCSAGKDRTGVISALVLGLLGVPRATIVADYALSQKFLDQINRRLRTSDSYQELMEELPEGAYEADPATVERFLDSLESDYGGPAGWARFAGLEAADLARLRARLLG